MKNRHYLTLLAAALLLGEARSLHAISSTFDSGLEGWTVNNTVPVFVATGGNSGGYMLIDNPETTISEIIAPSAFLGDLRAFIGGTLSFDGNMRQVLASPFPSYGTITIAGPSGTASLDIVPGQPALDLWTTYSVDLNAGTWGKTEAQWNSLLGNVTSLRLSVEAIFGGEQQGIDNFALASHAVPDAGSGGLLLLMGISSLALGNVWSRRSGIVQTH